MKEEVELQISDDTTRNDDGSAMVIALLIMILLMGFVALAVTRTTSETVASSNDATESRTFDAANASLEVMTRNFDKIFDTKLNPDPTDLTRIGTQNPPGFTPEYSFTQTVAPTGPAKAVIMKGGPFQGLNAFQDEWQLDTTTTNTATGVQVALRRRFLNNRIPIFQFGIFYDDDMEFHPGPVFNFGGRVHSNGNIFLAAGSGLYFASKVTAHNNVFTDVGKNGKSYTTWGDNVFVRNGSGVPTRVFHDMGSVLTSPVNGAAVPNYSLPLPPAPTAYPSAGWKVNSGKFDGNLLANQPLLQLPIKLNAANKGVNNLDLVALIRRGKNVGDLWNSDSIISPRPAGVPNINAVTAVTKDDAITASERYYNKTGIRVSLADSQAKLPGCAAVVAGNPCGIRLDGDSVGQGADPGVGAPRGYQPRAMSDGYQATEINGERFYTTGKQVWIKIETVQYDAATQTYPTADITQDILSLGVTQAPGAGTISDPRYAAGADSRSVIKLQRYVVSGAAIPRTVTVAPGSFMTPVGTDNYVVAGTVAAKPATTNCNDIASKAIVNGGASVPNAFAGDNQAHWRRAISAVGGTGIPGANGSKYGCIVPYPINMFDTREGLFNESTGVFDRATAYGTSVPWAGVMSMVDIDVANLQSFLEGNYDAFMPTTTPFAVNAARPLRAKYRTLPSNARTAALPDIPSANGWVFYVSDRRGDYDFDGEYDMEDIFGNNNGVLDLGEDVNGDGALQADYANHGGAQEAVKYVGAANIVTPDVAAVFEHKYYRRGVRLINGSDLPGYYDTATPANTMGFTVASENGVYVSGNYNAVGDVTAVGSPSLPADYAPQGTRDVPSSIAADAVTVLSNSWSDANSFANPFNNANRQTNAITTTRFAMLAGDSITTIDATPNQGGADTRMNGGVHNFIRFLEQWNVRLNYCGSLINLFNAHNNNGTYKNGGGAVYNPPTRNWIFDDSFLDINRIPPGTPFFQSIQITGFQRINN